MSQHQRADHDRPGTQKDPDEWVSGDEPMTGAQQSYLETLSRQTGEPVEAEMTKAQASEKIDELRRKAGLEEQATADRQDELDRS